MPQNSSAKGRKSAGQTLAPMNNFIYDFLLWTFSILVDLFFREVHPRSSWKIPRSGPVIFVAAPHANQFVDPLILMRVVRMEAARRICFLIAEKSMRRKFIGWFARNVGALPVGRALDSTRPAPGKVYLPDPVNDPTLVRGVGTNFEGKDFQVGGLVVLPSVDNTAASAEILEIRGPEELRVKKPFKGGVALRQLTGREDISDEGKIMNGNGTAALAEGFEGINFKVAPKVDQSKVYDAVFEKLNQGGCVGIFPEGGSHDRTELLPLKAGVAIMALGALAANPNSGLKIVPVGMNYFHAHKFRSRAVIEFGTPVEVPQELIELYKQGERREAVGKLLENVYNALVAVTVTAPDYDTLMLIQAVRRLYNPKGKKLPLPMVIELNRRLVKGYERYKDDPRIVNLKQSVLAYNKKLMMLNVRDHQVEYATFSIHKVVFMLLYRFSKLLLLSIGVLPGLILFAPVFIAGKRISIRKSKEALAASTVKIQAKDVVATWKLLVSMAFAPLLYNFYTILLASWTYRNRIRGLVPESVPIWAVFICGWILFPTITYAALRFGEVGMDIFKSLRPLALSLNPSSSNTLHRLRVMRADLVRELNDVINELGPEMYPDFDHARIVADPFHDESPKLEHFKRRDSEYSLESMPSSPSQSHVHVTDTSMGSGLTADGHLPRNESFKNLGNIALFATRPTTPSKPRSRTNSSGGLAGSGGFPLQGFSTLDSSGGFEEVSKKIRGAMRERGQRRRSSNPTNEWELGSGSGATTPGSEVSGFSGFTDSKKEK
ncbi:putative glycerol-3-phosphate o-acyltransferase [Diplodia seriata]|nr:putative glycerol-3-phosphate o-acyltransferase [Diplodia seriata]